jgi:hypothetical protein
MESRKYSLFSKPCLFQTLYILGKAGIHHLYLLDSFTTQTLHDSE